MECLLKCIFLGFVPGLCPRPIESVSLGLWNLHSYQALHRILVPSLKLGNPCDICPQGEGEC